MADNRLDVGLLINAGVEGLDQIDRVLENMGDLGASTDQLSEEAERLRREWDNLSPEEQAERMEALARALNDTQQRNQDLNAAAEQSVGIFGRMKGAILALGAALGVVFVAGKIKAFFSDAVAGAADFEQQLSTVQAVSGASAEEMARLRDAAEEMGAQTKYNATEAAQGLENLARAGLSASESIEALPSVLALAQGNSIGLAEAASYITQAASGMGLAMSESARVADVLSKAAASANTNINDMGQALSYAAPVAASLGLTIEETAAYIGKFADAGIQGSRAGTALNNMMAQFANPASTFKRELAAIGIRTSDFNQAIRELAAAGPLGAAAINALGMEAGPAFKALLGQGIGALDELTAKLEDASGFVTGQAAVMDDNLHGAFAGLESAWDALKNTISAPILDPLQTKLKELAGTINAMVNSGKVEALGEKIAATFENGADAVIRFVKEFDFGWLIDKIAAGFDLLSGVGRGLNATFQALHIGVQGVKSGFAALGLVITTIVQVASNAALGIIGIGAAVSDFFGITDNAVGKITDTLDGVNQAAADARAALTDIITKSGESIIASGKSIAGVAADSANQAAASLATIPAAAEEAAARAVHPMLALYQSMSDKVRAVTGVAEREAAKQAKAAQEAARKTQDAQEQAAVAAKDAFAGIGVDLDEVFTGISSKTRKAMSDYTYAVEQAMASGQDATRAARAGFEALAETLESPQAWAAYKQHLQDTGVGLDHLSQNQLKRMEDAIRGLPDVAATAMQAMKARIDSADVGSFARIRAEAQSAFAAGELSAAQYAEVMRDLHDKTEQLRSKTQETGASAAQAHDKAAEAAKRETEAKKENNEEQERGLTYAESAANLINSAIGSYYQSIEALELHTTQLHQLRDAFNSVMMASRASTIDEALQNIKGIGDAVVAGGQRIMAMEQHIDQLTETLTSGAYSAQDLSRAMGALHTTTVDVKGAYISLDDTKLANLNAAIDAARQKLADMKQEAEDTRASLEAQLASLKGDDSKAQALEEEKRLRELNLKLQDAEAKGQRDIAAEYRQAIALQKQVFGEERRQTQQRKAEEAKRKEEATKRQNNSTGNSTSRNSSASGSSGKGISADEVADAWDARIAAAENRGAENFARELYNQAKRQAR